MMSLLVIPSPLYVLLGFIFFFRSLMSDINILIYGSFEKSVQRDVYSVRWPYCLRG